MKIQNQLTNAIAPVRNKLGRSPWRRLAFIIPLAIGLASVAISPPALACEEKCDDYPDYNTGFGYSEFSDAGPGTNNTGFGAFVLEAGGETDFNYVPTALAELYSP